jgi:hypothetical protein
MIRLSSPCPACGHPWVYQATVSLPGSNGSALEGAARECMAPGCGWWEITPLPARSRR